MTHSVGAMRDTTFVEIEVLERHVGIVTLTLCCLLQTEGALSIGCHHFIQSSNSDELYREEVKSGCMLTTAILEIFHDDVTWLICYEPAPQVIHVICHLEWHYLNDFIFENPAIAVSCHHTWINRENVH